MAESLSSCCPGTPPFGGHHSEIVAAGICKWQGGVVVVMGSQLCLRTGGGSLGNWDKLASSEKAEHLESFPQWQLSPWLLLSPGACGGCPGVWRWGPCHVGPLWQPGRPAGAWHLGHSHLPEWSLWVNLVRVWRWREVGSARFLPQEG